MVWNSLYHCWVFRCSFWWKHMCFVIKISIMFCNNIKLFSFSFLGDCWKRSLEGDVWKCYWKRKQYSFKKCVFLNRYQTLHKKQAIKIKPWVYKSKSKVKNDMCFLASHCIDTVGRVQLSFRRWADYQSWERFNDIFQEWFLHWSHQLQSSYSPCQAPWKEKYIFSTLKITSTIKCGNILPTLNITTKYSNIEIFCPPWPSPRAPRWLFAQLRPLRSRRKPGKKVLKVRSRIV